MSKVYFQVLQGIWSPADKKHSWVVVDDFDSYMEAKRWCHKEGAQAAPLAIVEMRSKVMWRREREQAGEVL